MADVTLKDVAHVPPFELVFDSIAENEVKVLLDLEVGSESEMSCYSSTWTVYVDFVSRLLLWRATCLMTFNVTAINKNVDQWCTS
jgi:hypothetical protein